MAIYKINKTINNYMSILSKIITTPKAEILCLGGLPEDAFDIEVGKGHYKGKLKLTFRTKSCIYEDHTIISNEDNWQPVGFLKDISEDDAKGLLPESEYSHLSKDSRWYYALLFDFIESEVKLKNSDKPKIQNYLIEDSNPLQRANTIQYSKDLKKWQSEQSEIFINPFIMIKK